MDKQILADIAADAAELSNRLTEAGFHDSAEHCAVLAGAMPAIARYEIDVLRRPEPLVTLRGGPEDRQQAQARELHGTFGRTLEDPGAGDGPPP